MGEKLCISYKQSTVKTFLSYVVWTVGQQTRASWLLASWQRNAFSTDFICAGNKTIFLWT